MNFIWSGLFWGVLLVLIGISVIVKTVLKIDVPIFKIVFALVLIYFGLKLLFGTSHKTKDTIIFNNSKMTISAKSDEYNVIFGSGEIDLRNIDDLEGETFEILVVGEKWVIVIVGDDIFVILR